MQILHAILEQNQALSLDAGDRVERGMFNEALRRCERLAKHDCLVCIVSDGFGHDEESRKLLTLIAQHNDVLFAFIYDPLGSGPSRGRPARLRRRRTAVRGRYR